MLWRFHFQPIRKDSSFSSYIYVVAIYNYTHNYICCIIKIKWLFCMKNNSNPIPYLHCRKLYFSLAPYALLFRLSIFQPGHQKSLVIDVAIVIIINVHVRVIKEGSHTINVPVQCILPSTSQPAMNPYPIIHVNLM